MTGGAAAAPLTGADSPGGVPAEWTEPENWRPVPMPEPLPAPVIDSHTHLDALGCRTTEDVAGLLEQAATVGVAGAVTVADDLASAQWAAAAAAQHPSLWAAVGLHPTRADRLDDDARVEISTLARQPDVVAIGETGLDYYWAAAPRPAQREAFAWHIDLAKQVGKALMVHDRLAHEDLLDILRVEGPPATVVFHCFSGDEAMARYCADQGFLLSFAGPVTFRNARELRAAAQAVPEECLMVETDAPFLAPHPHRGRKNHPAAVVYTLRDLAELRKTDVVGLANRVMSTTRQTYQLQ